MKKEEKLTITPFSDNMTYDSSSWLVINVQSDEKPEVIFYTASQDEEESFKDLKDFSNFIFDEKFSFSSNDTQVDKDANNTKSTISGCIVKEEDDHDDEKSFKVLVANGQIIDVYQNIALEAIPQLVEESKKALDRLEKNEKENFADSELYKKDPHSYYGVSRSDFF